MPELARFYGIIIYMYRELGGRHHYPHIHAESSGTKAVFHIETGEIIELKLYFADKTEQTIDFEPVLRGAWLRPLREPDYFRKVRLNEAGNLEWPDGQDFNPESLHDWQKFEPLYLEDGKQIEAAEQQTKKESKKTIRKTRKPRKSRQISRRKPQPIE